MLRILLALFIGSLIINTHAMAQDSIIRKHLLTAALISKTVTKVEVREINFKPLQQTGLHKHPCPVVGYIVEGTVTFQVKGEAIITLHAGDAFYEPADTEMLHFDNASDKATVKFIACYLLNGDQPLIQPMPKN